MAVSTAVFPKAPAAVRHPRVQRCAGAAMSSVSGDSSGVASAGGVAVPGVRSMSSDAGSVTAAAEAILLRERLRSQQLLSARRLPVARRAGGPVECPRSAPARGYRMGRWERLGMTLVAAVAVLVVSLVSINPSSAPTRDTVALPGDTMLSIALREMPGVDPARAAELIGAANGSADLRIVPGMTVAIPLER